jgi:predicted dehydrogenase
VQNNARTFLKISRLRKATVDDNVAGIIAWPGGVLGSIRANWCSPADARNFIWETRIHGADGVIFINMAAAGNNLVVFSPGRPIEGAEKVVHNGLGACYRPALPAWDLHRDILSAFAQAIAGPRAAEERLAAARQHHVIEIIAKLYQSSRTGRAQTLATTY